MFVMSANAKSIEKKEEEEDEETEPKDVGLQQEYEEPLQNQQKPQSEDKKTPHTFGRSLFTVYVLSM